MNWDTFLDQLAEEGLMLWPDGDNLAFEGPEEALTPARLQTLKRYKPDLLLFLRHATKQESLSYGQQALWFEHQMMPGGFAYNVSLSLRIHSLVEPATLEYVFQLLVNRHSTLRTTFPLNNNQPVQQVHRYQQVCLQQINAGEWSEPELKEQVMTTHELPFDLAQGPLFRLSLFTRQANDHVLLFTLHHLICDGWSIWLMLDELLRLFTAVLSDEPAVLPLLPTTYHDYVASQAHLLQENEEKLWGYWQNALVGELPLLDLPTDYPRPAVRRYQGASQPLLIPNQLMGELIALAQHEGVTLYMVLLASFQILLHRYTGQDDILVGSPIAGRNRPELASIVGYFTNPVVMRADLGENLSFRDFLAQVRQTVLGGFEHQEYPFPLLVQRLQPPRAAGVSAIFQTLFILQKAQTDTQIMELMRATRADPQYFGGLYLSPFSLPQFEGQFDLSLELFHSSTDLSGALKYNPELFAPTTIERMIGHWHTLLQGIVADPSQGVHELPLLTAAERHQLLVEWNETQADCPTDRCFHELFEAQAARTPEAPAVFYHAGDSPRREADGERKCLTYRELNERANQLAHHLRALGVGRPEGTEAVVGVCMERCPETVISLLAIFKAGGVYIPLDPALPEERLSYMLSNSEALVVLSKRQYASHLTSYQAQTVYLDLEHEMINAQAITTRNPVNLSKPQNLAYVIYTSGSTGLPKGAMVEQQGMVNHLYTKIIDLDLTSNDRIAETAPQSFDISIWQFLSALLVGGAVHIFDDETVRDPAQLLRRTETQKITILEVVPSLFRFMLDNLATAGANRPDFSSLRWLLLTGEALPPDLCREWFAYYPHIPLMNAYGPTECSDDVTHHAIYAPPPPNAMSVPIGQAVPNMRLYILDRYLQPVPIGVPGEMYVGGIGVGRGYLNDPERTAKAFMDDPFVPAPDARFYKTGDLCRYLSDTEKEGSGTIEFLGRTDHQVKIRGFRIELGEIEATLRQSVDVREAVVMVASETEHSGGRKRLVAYITFNDGVAREVDRLRAELSDKLPNYMIPAAFVPLEAMPLTPNGKINRRALLESHTVRPPHRQESAPVEQPRTAVERILATIWQELLGLPVGITDNFFQVGGDSILSMQIVSRAKEAGIELTPNELFQHQTIAELASVARYLPIEQGSVKETATEQEIVTGMLPLTPIQHDFLAQMWREPHHYNQSFLLELAREVNPTWLSQAVGHLLAHHDALRLRFECQAAHWRQEIVPPEPLYPFEVIDLSTVGANEQAAMLEKKANELQASLNLSEGPLLRVALFQSGHGNRLLIVIHHLAVDGVSWRILLEDLQRAYQQLASGQRVQLPAKTTSFKQWAALLHEKGPTAFQAERDYWAELCMYEHPLPTDYRLGANDYASAANISTRLDSTQTQALLNEVPAVYQTQINDLLLTALLLTFQEWSGQPTLLLELEGHGREPLFEVDLSRTVGWFTSAFPVHLEVTTFDLGDTIKEIKEQLRQIPHRGIGYGILRYLSPFQIPEVNTEVSFNYLGQLQQIASGSLINAFATQSSGSPYSPFAERPHLLEINSMVVEGQLQVDWSYSQNFHRSHSIQQLANGFIDALQMLIEHCQEPEAGGYTPSDFPAAELNQEELDNLLSGLKV